MGHFSTKRNDPGPYSTQKNDQNGGEGWAISLRRPMGHSLGRAILLHYTGIIHMDIIIYGSLNNAARCIAKKIFL